MNHSVKIASKKRRIDFIAVLFCLIFCAGGRESARGQAAVRTGSARATLPIGSSAPDFSLTGTDGKMHRLAEYENGKVVAIVFTCNSCPMAQLYESRIKKLASDYASKGVVLVAIQSNALAAESPTDLSYSDVDDSIDGMKSRSDFGGFNFAYLYDGDGQTVTSEYGPKVLPEIFIFDQQRKLQYEGRIDNNLDESKVDIHDARAALDQILTGKPVTVPNTTALGCPIIRKEEIAASQRQRTEWEAAPVNLEPATADVLRNIRENHSGKTLIVNFWATWCGPCVEEFSDVVQTYLMYRNRGVDLVTVSVDSPDQREDVLEFLSEHHSGVRNLQFASDDLFALQAAFDERWDSGVPYTMVIAPSGRVIYEEKGEVHLVRMRRAILAGLSDRGPFDGSMDYWRRRIAAEH